MRTHADTYRTAAARAPRAGRPAFAASPRVPAGPLAPLGADVPAVMARLQN